MNHTSKQPQLVLGSLLIPVLVALVSSLSAQGPTLGTAAAFAVLGASTVTNTGSSAITGDLGVAPGFAITGFPPGVVTGTIHAGDAVALQAQSDATIAYNALAGAACNTNLTGQDLGGLTLPPGVYCFSSSAQLTGTLTLNAQGNTNAVFIIQIGSTLTTASASAVDLVNGTNPCNVFWQIGSSATLGTTTSFVGNVIAQASITINTGATLNGRALALTAAVTMDTNSVQVPSSCCFAIASWTNYGVGWPGTLGIPSLTLSALPVLGTAPNVVIQNTYVNPTFLYMLWGDGPVSIPTAYGGTILVQALFSFSFFIGTGQQTLALPIPLDPQLNCVSFNLQALLYDKGASHFVAFTPGLNIVLGM